MPRRRKPLPAPRRKSAMKSHLPPPSPLLQNARLLQVVRRVCRLQRLADRRLELLLLVALQFRWVPSQ